MRTMFVILHSHFSSSFVFSCNLLPHNLNQTTFAVRWVHSVSTFWILHGCPDPLRDWSAGMAPPALLPGRS